MAGRDLGGARGRRGADPRVAPSTGRRASMHMPGVGLVLVLLALTAFAVTAAVTNVRAAERAQHSAAVSAWSETALDQLVVQEDLVDELKSPGPEADGEAPREYAVADDAVATALLHLQVSVDAHYRPQVKEWIALHERYGREVALMRTKDLRDPSTAEEYEEAHLDPHFDPLESGLDGEVQRHWDEASESLAAVSRIQHVLVVATPVVFGLGLGLVVLFSVVQVRGRRLAVAQAEENRRQATHDALTGLPNRTLLRDRVQHALATALDDGTTLTLLLLDLDRFKEINDTLGHRYGDLVLGVVAARLRHTLPATATVARLGGDEFAVLLPDAGDVRTALQVAVRVLGALDDTIDAEGISLDVDASIGVVLSGAHGQDVDTLLQHADIAMYRAKERGQGVCVYDHELNDHSLERLGLLGELRRAIDTGELVLDFQPKVSLPDGGFRGAEALVRWRHPERGLLPPGLFIPVAERTALIHPLTRYVVGAALAECRRWQDRGLELHVAVNVSVRNLLDDTFLDDVAAMLAQWQVPASCLELEVTESAVMADPERARSVLAGFAALGITLSIDDFGAGYTSLAHLTKLPVHQLKIDRSLVQRMSGETGDALVVRSVIELGHRLGLRIIAEGVEDPATAAMLADLRCDVAQGYWFGRPVPADRLVEWYEARRFAAAVVPAGAVRAGAVPGVLPGVLPAVLPGAGALGRPALARAHTEA